MHPRAKIQDFFRKDPKDPKWTRKALGPNHFTKCFRVSYVVISSCFSGPVGKSQNLFQLRNQDLLSAPPTSPVVLRHWLVHRDTKKHQYLGSMEAKPNTTGSWGVAACNHLGQAPAVACLSGCCSFWSGLGCRHLYCPYRMAQSPG